jgi:hypothetical protein
MTEGLAGDNAADNAAFVKNAQRQPRQNATMSRLVVEISLRLRRRRLARDAFGPLDRSTQSQLLRPLAD